MDLEIDRMNEEIIELREDNQRLQKMYSIVEQMNDILNEVMNECKCFSDQTIDTKTKLNDLKDKYNQLKDSEIQSSTNSYSPQSVRSVSTQTNHTFLKRLSTNESSDDFETIDTILTSNYINVKQNNNLLSIDAINDTLYRQTTDELNLAFILPKIETNVELIDCKQTKTNEKSNKRIKKCKNDIKTIKRSKLKKRAKRVCCDWPGCHMKFRDSYNMSVHLLRHSGHKSFVCSKADCHKTYTTKAALDVHHNSHLDNRQFKCQYSECGAAFIRKTQLNVHISQSHTHDFPYKCNWPGCEYQGCYLNRLNSHRLSHTGIKPLKCEWKGCHQTFRLNHHLKAHMLKHTGEKPIPCQLSDCDKRFQSKQAMKIHFERTHSNSKPSKLI